MATISIENCQHEGALVHDQHTGDEICTDCALVMDGGDIVFSEKDLSQVTFAEADSVIKVIVLDLIHDFCANCHIPRNIQRKAIAIASTKPNNKQNRFLAAYSIYISLIEANAPWSMHRVASYFNITSKHFWSYITEQSRHFIFETKPSHHSACIFFELDIAYKIGLIINDFSDKLSEEHQFAPTAILCIVILHMIKERWLPPMEATRVSFACNISLSTVRRVRKVLESEVRKGMNAMKMRKNMK